MAFKNNYKTKAVSRLKKKKPNGIFKKRHINNIDYNTRNNAAKRHKSDDPVAKVGCRHFLLYNTKEQVKIDGRDTAKCFFIRVLAPREEEKRVFFSSIES